MQRWWSLKPITPIQLWAEPRIMTTTNARPVAGKLRSRRSAVILVHESLLPLTQNVQQRLFVERVANRRDMSNSVRQTRRSVVINGNNNNNIIIGRCENNNFLNNTIAAAVFDRAGVSIRGPNATQ